MEQTEQRHEPVLYHGSSNSGSRVKGNTKHLAVQGQETTLCGHVNIQYTQQGKINGRKTSPYKGPDRVLGRICSKCLQKVNT